MMRSGGGHKPREGQLGKGLRGSGCGFITKERPRALHWGLRVASSLSIRIDIRNRVGGYDGH